MVALGQREVVGGAQRLLAERLEVEPGDAACGARHRQAPAADGQRLGGTCGAVGQRLRRSPRASPRPPGRAAAARPARRAAARGGSRWRRRARSPAGARAAAR